MAESKQANIGCFFIVAIVAAFILGRCTATAPAPPQHLFTSSPYGLNEHQNAGYNAPWGYIWGYLKNSQQILVFNFICFYEMQDAFPAPSCCSHLSAGRHFPASRHF